MNGECADQARQIDCELRRQVCILRKLFLETPLIRLQQDGFDLFAKLELTNPTGSIKDRSAYWILWKAIERGEVTRRTTVVESSSGNFALALAFLCRLLGLAFIPVIDPTIMGTYEDMLRRLCREVVKVTEPDESGGYLKTRLRAVRKLCAEIEGAYWPNQYANLDAMHAHYHLTGAEICRRFDRLDYLFIGVSSGGTVTGVSRRVKRKFPRARIVAVDVEGSVIFGGAPRRRHIPGIGSSIVPPILQHARIDEVVLIPEAEALVGCDLLMKRHGLLLGGSSGSVYAAVERFRGRLEAGRAHAAFLCPDRGLPYLDTIYNPEWALHLVPIQPAP